MSAPDRRKLVDCRHGSLSIRRQCALLGIARSGVYRPPPAANDNDLSVMRRIDELFTAWPFLGSRRMTALLRAEGLAINRKRVQRLMRKMGIAALGPKPRTTKSAGAQDIPVSFARPDHRPSEPGVVRRHHLYPDRPRLALSGGDHGLGEPCGAGMAAVEHHGQRISPSRRLRRRSLALADQRSSIPTRAVSLPVPPSPPRCLPPVCASRWTAAADGWTTCSSSGCGAPSNTRTST